MAKKDSKYWTLYDFIEAKYNEHYIKQEFVRLPARKQKAFYEDYRNFIDNYTKGGKRE